ncbi:hypothetical protein QQZ08_008769 [Neonectria magnoliae]|uniref:D-isomer specific 2-hydroxyacid dehydrogenase NAD-binding domain-containing protein n=1 Tax=Neonectria magnoliae TaxID=2732573 RepID=A0ABR1HSG3_9HYPO
MNQRHFLWYQKQMNNEYWEISSVPSVEDSYKLRMGILGYGSIGRKCARMAQAMGLEEQFEILSKNTFLTNIAQGRHVDTEALNKLSRKAKFEEQPWMSPLPSPYERTSAVKGPKCVY